MESNPKPAAEPSPVTGILGIALILFAAWGFLSGNTAAVVNNGSFLDSNYIECGSVLSPSLADARGQGFKEDMISIARGKEPGFEELYIAVCNDRISSTRVKFLIVGTIGSCITIYFFVQRKRSSEYDAWINRLRERGESS